MYARAHPRGSPSFAVVSTVGASSPRYLPSSSTPSNEIVVLKRTSNSLISTDSLPQTSRYRATANPSSNITTTAFISEYTFPGEVNASNKNLSTNLITTAASSSRPSAPGAVEDDQYVTQIEISPPPQMNKPQPGRQQKPNLNVIESDPVANTSNQRQKQIDAKALANTFKLDDKTLKQYEEAFRIFDRNGDGRITCQELGTVMKSLGIQPSKEDLQNMVNEVDADGSGTIEFDEFVQMMARRLAERGEMDGEEELKGAFEVFDRNKDGYITAEELRMVMRSLGENLTDAELNEMMKAADANGDGIINFNEFQEVWLEAHEAATK